MKKMTRIAALPARTSDATKQKFSKLSAVVELHKKPVQR
jgi:hypothetical protein